MGLPLEVAVTKGRQEVDIQKPGTKEWAFPILNQNSSNSVLISFDKWEPEEIELFDTWNPPIDPILRREWDKYQLLLSIEEKNLVALEDSLHAKYRGERPASFIESQITDIKVRIKNYEAKLEEIKSRENS